MMDCIPLKVRVMDNEVLFDCFRSLFNHSRKLIIPFVPRIIDNITVVLSTKESFDHGGNCEKASKSNQINLIWRSNFSPNDNFVFLLS